MTGAGILDACRTPRGIGRERREKRGGIVIVRSRRWGPGHRDRAFPGVPACGRPAFI